MNLNIEALGAEFPLCNVMVRCAMDGEQESTADSNAAEARTLAFELIVTQVDLLHSLGLISFIEHGRISVASHNRWWA